MAYSCTDFTDEILNKAAQLGLIGEEDVPPDDPQGQAQLVVGAIDTLLEKLEDAHALLREAAVPGGIGEHAFNREGGWRDRVQKLLGGHPAQPPLYFIIADGNDGENADLLVRADNRENAIAAWHVYFDGRDLPDQPTRIGVVPLARGAGAIPWQDIGLRGEELALAGDD